MRVVCCRCDKWLQTVPGPDATSHGLCEPCSVELLRELRVMERAPMNAGLEVTEPVLLKTA